MTQLPDVDQLLERMEAGLREVLEHRGVVAPVMIGIRTGGVWLAEQLNERLGLPALLGELDISFYRDDFSRVGLNPKVMPSSLPFDTEGRDIVLIDDVLMSGRTIRAAMNEIFDYGRPSSIILATLVDLGARELPVQPDVTGQVLALAPNQRVKLRGPEPLYLELRETGE
ncbi:bifunctional pyr operon transcriptional regulator/uracil phosphoribosyltransferase PyrR [Marinobacter sp.]|uniref:bifunctional pyr operon transcriptional regulator/uracil phosphoribosyltransferase PyrR n=1 Tax=Marinobacter sp. TaxID=50741 RepID=UPI002B45C45D|nr:bifunctional pyr operon transcriptional regulator/uracil phosphoribosyltransferase PyrR [Marinobacter sp.]HKK56509.1 bifunctional pyr operon transcriptional regulator/uracil phosphoribosyltransferase PyrR [Marinobacter sp.]